MKVSIRRLAFSIAEAETLSGLSRATLYRRIKAGELLTVKNGGRRLIPAQALRAFCGCSDVEPDLIRADKMMGLFYEVR